MATINICDRPGCGALVKSDAMGSIELFTGGKEPENPRGHVCPACVDDLMTLWETEPSVREKSYGKPWQRTAETLSDMSSVQLMQLAIERGREELKSEESSVVPTDEPK